MKHHVYVLYKSFCFISFNGNVQDITMNSNSSCGTACIIMIWICTN